MPEACGSQVAHTALDSARGSFIHDPPLMVRLGMTIQLSLGDDRLGHGGSPTRCALAVDGRLWGFQYVGEGGRAVVPISLTNPSPTIAQARSPAAAPSLRPCACASGGASPMLWGNRRLIHRLEEYVES